MSSKTCTISKVGQRRQVVIPKKMCEDLGLGEADFVEVTPTRGGVLITPKKLDDRDDGLTTKDAKSLRRGLAQMRKGRTRAWDKIKDELDR